VTGSFVLDESLGEPAQFTVFTHNIENPLIRGISLVSPSQVVYSAHSDSLVAVKLLTLFANINEVSAFLKLFGKDKYCCDVFVYNGRAIHSSLTHYTG
jgi:hypothetical protein